MVFSLLISALVATANAGAIDKRQAAASDSVTLAQRAAFFCPPGIDSTLPLDGGREAGLRFCSRVDRWSPATLYSSNPLNVGSGQYRLAASRCAALCTGVCQTFSVAPATPGNATFGCNLYNATVPFRGDTNGGLFYQRQNISGAQPSSVTVSQVRTATVCPTPVSLPSTTVTITGPTQVATFPVVYRPPGQQATTITAPTQVVTQTTTITSTRTTVIAGQTTTVLVPVARQTVGAFSVFVSQQGPVTITEIRNNVVTVVVVVVQGDLNRPVSTSTSSVAPTATNTFQCPAGIVGQYQDTTNSGTVFNLRFCSNTQRWSPNDLFSSTPIAGASYASAAQVCSQRCNSTICATFSVAPTTVGGSTFNCNLYNATNVFNGPTNGGLFYQRQAAPFVSDQQASQCVGSLPRVSASGISYTREFCSRTERWSPATLFDGSVQTGQSRNGAAPIVEAVQKCAARCAGFGARCETFSTTFTEQNPPTGDSAVPVNFNCNIYNATLRVLGNTQGGAFYLAQLSGFNATTPAAKRFAH